jgi:hypothetical protein
MADIIRLNGDAHAQTQHLLPWYVTGALTEKEAAQVEAHLAECAECRADAEIEATVARQVKTLPFDVERGWATLKARIEEPRPKTTLLGRRIPLCWALAAQAASLALMVALLAYALAQPQRLHGTPVPAPAGGDLIVVFRPDASEAALRATLMQSQARIVDGPTTSGAYVLYVAPGRRPAALARLKSDPNVALAQPVDRPSPP